MGGGDGAGLIATVFPDGEAGWRFDPRAILAGVATAGHGGAQFEGR